MAAPHVAATAALVIASGVLGRHPCPAQVLARLERPPRRWASPRPNQTYGYGLVNAGRGHRRRARTPTRRSRRWRNAAPPRTLAA